MTRARHTSVLVGVGLLAVVLRGWPYLRPGGLTAILEYDDGAMFSGSIALAAGHLPYRDFVAVHPPGILLALLPASWVSHGVGEPAALGYARIAVWVIGGVNAALVANLLRRHGAVAMITGGALYAGWHAAMVTESTVLLEPALNLGLLIALHAVRGRVRPVGAGIALGLALTFKYWAAADLAVFAVVIGLRAGRRALARYAIAAAVTVALVIGPFFVAAPGSMIDQTIRAQLVRPASAPSPVGRLSAFVPASVPGIRGAALAVLLAAIGVLAVAHLIGTVRHTWSVRDQPGAWPTELWWAVLLAVHLVAVLVSPSFYLHYVSWTLVPACLLAGAGAGAARLPDLLGRRTSTIVAGGALLSTVVLIAFAAQARATAPVAADPTGQRAATQWATARRCVWAYPSELIYTDRVAQNLQNGCQWDIDPLGTALTLHDATFDQRSTTAGQLTATNRSWQAHAFPQIMAADGVVLPTTLKHSWFDPEQTSQFEARFATVPVAGPYAWQSR